MFIRQANDQPAIMMAGGTYWKWIERELFLRWRGHVPTRTTSGAVLARVVRSDWAAPCSFCRNVQVIQRGEPFFCVDCAMQGNHGLAMEVTWPSDQKAIEAILAMRPDPNTRNWTPGETVRSLIAENKTRGVLTGV